MALMKKWLILLVSVMGLTLLVAACGSIVTPESEAERATLEAEAAAGETGDEGEVAVVPTATRTPEPTATETPEPTATTEPPTATPEPAAEEPTAEPQAAPQSQLEFAALRFGDVAAGEETFNSTINTAAGPWACATCHSIEPDMRLIGPSLWNVSIRAATRIEGMGAAEYIQDSILHPSDFIVPSDTDVAFQDGLMPQNYEAIFGEQDIYNLIAYLYTLTDE